ncbi:MAG: hypothetical protein ACLPN1_09665 [Dissulfurispiraceae bacterium]|jgi:hypothetical protein
METKERICDLKRHIFYELLDMAGRVMVLVKYSPDVVIGNRGFVGEEKSTGIILVFNPKMKFTWDEFGITATLVFGAAPQKCFIPSDSIAAVYSPELNSQFISSTQESQASKEQAALGVEEGVKLSKSNAFARKIATDSKKNVISVDFVKKKLLKD